jgi:hypothetical protein
MWGEHCAVAAVHREVPVKVTAWIDEGVVALVQEQRHQVNPRHGRWRNRSRLDLDRDRGAACCVDLETVDLPNNRFKLPFFMLCAGVFVLLLVQGELVVFSAILLALSVVCIVVIASGRNPRWLQSPLDRWEAKKHRRSN